MRLELQQSELDLSQTASASGAEVRPIEQEDPIPRHMEVVQQVTDQRCSVIDLARRLGVEEQQARYPWEDFGDDIDSIVDTYGDDDEEEWFSEEHACGEEGHYLDCVYYAHPKSSAEHYRLDY